MKRVLAPFALGLAALYLALAVGAAGCLIVHSELPNPTSHQHHSKSHLAHSAFCAWACQANPTVALLVETPPAVVLQLVALLVLLRTSMIMRVMAHVAHPRAPPR